MQPNQKEIIQLTPTLPALQQVVRSNHGFSSIHLDSSNSLISREKNENDTNTSEHLRNNGEQQTCEVVGFQDQPYISKQVVHRKKTSSCQRIFKHESVSIEPSYRKIEEIPNFRVMNKSKGTIFGPQLAEFPNEVLTQIFSYLPATSLSIVSLVSKRFHILAATSHVWRIAFSRFFSCQDAVDDSVAANISISSLCGQQKIRSEIRFFCRLTCLPSWRSEYITRTKLIRCIRRGRPLQITKSAGIFSQSQNSPGNITAVVTFSSGLRTAVKRIHAIFGSEGSPRFIHGTNEPGSATLSNPSTGKVGDWGLSQIHEISQFSEIWTGRQPYGLDDNVIGAPNPMEVSQPYGMIVGECLPGGKLYFRASDEIRGRFLPMTTKLVDHETGIPAIPEMNDGISAVWIAKSKSVPTVTKGLIGMFCGSTLGIVTAYSLGHDNSLERRIPRGTITARWALSPGVPIIALEIDESFNIKRKSNGRVWAVALNALGEVFYLTELPSSILIHQKLEKKEHERQAWITGRTVQWELVESSRRSIRDNPYNTNNTQARFYSRSSSKNSNLSPGQLKIETYEVEKQFHHLPGHFRKTFDGWDMRRRLHVDFAGDDKNGAGEAIFVIMCGTSKKCQSKIERLTRYKTVQKFAENDSYAQLSSTELESVPKFLMTSTSLESSISTLNMDNISSPKTLKDCTKIAVPNNSFTETEGSGVRNEWHITRFSMKEWSDVEIICSAIDMSKYALMTIGEDPIFHVREEKNKFSHINAEYFESIHSSLIPGHRARLLAIGTKTGSLILWNMRGNQSTNPHIINESSPLRMIQTDSPKITCVAVSALQVVHGGSDGLVQAWDPLASTTLPIRTLNSRFSSQTRRRLIQAEVSTTGMAIQLPAAGSIVLDPDPNSLRGMVSLGTHLRYWAYSSSENNESYGKKFRTRRACDGLYEHVTDKFTNTGRGELQDYINSEREELKRNRLHQIREDSFLRRRFGVGIGDLTEEESIRYAEMISAEEYAKNEQLHAAQSEHLGNKNVLSDDVSVLDRQSSEPNVRSSPYYNFEKDLEEAIRLSLNNDNL
ncbi:BgTH12-04744 [Blumeria graminis f. sp. triticale]|uniref:Bgt-5088 n=3 Tax=Blumeria graminis TaxID=34373 RepID=A0A061HL92_BLUGR|nr:hypothetical protein BGT96224_5088 [Blumeria graminis f. sp. tritici 96224]CAD6499092.1 BgTH12-04744 [Blumeria graminis f. sp. triticale]VCU39227.1 Bgt-5088 [Blumeria graminis f. sp. tritici]